MLDAEENSRALVLDTNIWNKYFHLERLQDLAHRLSRKWIEVWIPEQILLEWAEHAHTDHVVTIRNSWKKLRYAGLVEGELPDLDDVVNRLRQQIAAVDNVRILEMRGGSAIEGIRNQILGTGPGTVRGSGEKAVKTGAVDSSWVRDAIAQARDEARNLIVLSNNRGDVDAVVADEGTDVLVETTTSTKLDDLVLDVRPPSDAIVKAVARAVLRYEPQPMSYPESPPVEPWLSPEMALNPGDFPTLTISRQAQEVGVMPEPDPRVIGIRNVGVLQTDPDALAETADTGLADDSIGFVDFDLVVLANLVVAWHEPDLDGQPEMRGDRISDVLLTIPYTADLGVSNRIGEMRQTADATAAEALGKAFTSGSAAYKWFCEELEQYAGLEVTSGEIQGPNGQVATFNVPEDTHDEWLLSFEIEGEPVATLRCGSELLVNSPEVVDGVFNMSVFYSLTAGSSWHGPYDVIAELWRRLVGPRS